MAKSQCAYCKLALHLCLQNVFFLPIEYIRAIKRRKSIPVVFIAHKEESLLSVLEIDGGIYSLDVPWKPKVINSARRALYLESSCYPIVGA